MTVLKRNLSAIWIWDNFVLSVDILETLSAALHLLPRGWTPGSACSPGNQSPGWGPSSSCLGFHVFPPNGLAFASFPSWFCFIVVEICQQNLGGAFLNPGRADVSYGAKRSLWLGKMTFCWRYSGNCLQSMWSPFTIFFKNQGKFLGNKTCLPKKFFWNLWSNIPQSK